ncbi:MAG: TerB family tellurite resistance protein [Rhodothermia bacterium]|nr:TerB family tellurite resistance protein [Rhodothermia bacterium]
MNENWSTTHDLALMFVSCAYRGDGVLDDVERQAVRTMLLLRFPDLERADADRIVDHVFLIYLSDSGAAMLSAAVHTLGTELSKTERTEIVKDLSGIASSDGLVFPAEADFIARVARQWQVSGPPSDT